MPAHRPGSSGRGVRRGSAASVIAKALTLLVLGVGVGAYHSIREPISLRMAAVETSTVRLPTGRTTDEPSSIEGQGEGPTSSGNATPDAAAGSEQGSNPATTPSGAPGTNPLAADPQAADPDVLVLEQFINLDTAHRLWEAGAAEFVDARHVEEFALGHIPRANLYDPRTMYSATPEWTNWLDFDSAILVVYCDGGLCDASQNAVRQLQGLGFKRLHIMEDGFPAWKAAGHAFDVGEPGATRPANPQ